MHICALNIVGALPLLALDIFHGHCLKLREGILSASNNFDSVFNRKMQSLQMLLNFDSLMSQNKQAFFIFFFIAKFYNVT